MRERQDLGAKIEVLRDDPVFMREGVILGITEQIVALMEQQGLKRVELAARLNKTPGFVTKLLSGRNNFTLKTLVEIGRALGRELKVTFVDSG